jgi:putative SOS response-associated peptidase YedK
MCGRFTLGEVKELAIRFSVDHPLADVPRLRYNIAPGQDVPIVVAEGSRSLTLMRWGLVPFWAKDPKVGNRMINARSETVTEKPAFRSAMKARRCIVPTTGFYEWKGAGDGKRPYLARLKEEGLFGMAGLYERWTSPQKADMLSFTILTTEANDLMAGIHDRMPVILYRRDEEAWLTPEPLDAIELERIFTPFSSDRMEAYEVSTRVNDASVEGEELIAPIKKASMQAALF